MPPLIAGSHLQGQSRRSHRQGAQSSVGFQCRKTAQAVEEHWNGKEEPSRCVEHVQIMHA
jgi:hypothetical protein